MFRAANHAYAAARRRHATHYFRLDTTLVTSKEMRINVAKHCSRRPRPRKAVVPGRGYRIHDFETCDSGQFIVVPFTSLVQQRRPNRIVSVSYGAYYD